jgi:uncharacterized protein
VADPRTVLERTGTIAVVGMSTDPDKDSHRIPMALRDAGFTIVPVHPEADRIGDLEAHASLTDLPEPPDLVNVFRPAEEAPAIARQAVALGAKALWLQLEITSTEARAIAEEAGLAYVEDHCVGRERDRHEITRG